jgi:splicing factor 3A subunit 1
MEHHMRIELLDPRWKEQRAKAESRYATTNLSTADVANNLKRLASQRSDVFDAVVTEATGVTGPDGQQDASPGIDLEEESRRKRVAMGIGVGIPMSGGIPGYDGPQGLDAPKQSLPPPPPPMQSINIEEQIRHIHQKFKQ